MKNLEFKGSKGKWKVVGENYFSIECFNTDEDTIITKPTIATINTTFIDREEALSNARLMASAPELLKVLKRLVYLNNNEDAQGLSPWHNAFREAEEVINKALEL